MSRPDFKTPQDTIFESSFNPEVMWGCTDGGRNAFTVDIGVIKARKDNFIEPYLQAFKDAVRLSTKRVWIIDEYLFKSDERRDQNLRIESILEWFPPQIEASDIRILTKYDKTLDDIIDRFNKKTNEINTNTSKRPTKCSIQINTNLTAKFGYIHDRFAIVDNELWHFGATVGGFYSKINAVSRGWDAINTKAEDFFNLAWSHCNEC